ncbi:hypothetical protein [Hymenobacter weizhouensis]|uniref:hypothetical protein n=1 Tax=Hymenobacter sp. YIM 151500-1 TaxID=2987689 RepID=UPI002225D145|nr:hypothetical protein [Hymenobacter sp. YIM 151500-1]UYZ64304.1 hypothetical protein OIS53_05500 [Hymenobacter sp. YIM 151500-1]
MYDKSEKADLRPGELQELLDGEGESTILKRNHDGSSSHCIFLGSSNSVCHMGYYASETPKRWYDKPVTYYLISSDVFTNNTSTYCTISYISSLWLGENTAT